MKSTAEILELLRIYKTQFASKYGFKRLGVFGSVARGEQTEQSDVDVCYEELLGSPVDLIRIRERMNARLKQRILKESIYV